jgi:hypothetical protein
LLDLSRFHATRLQQVAVLESTAIEVTCHDHGTAVSHLSQAGFG